MSHTPVLPKYTEVRDAIVRILVEGHERARLAVEREKVRTCWEVGRLLFEHLQMYKSENGRADYGEQVVKRLAGELEIGERRLYKMLEFGRAYKIMPTSSNLTFTHYVTLISVKDLEAREHYERAADEGSWSVRQLAAAVKARAFLQLPEGPGDEGRGAGEAPPVARRGRLYTYRLLEPAGDGRPRVDLGFRIRLQVELGGSLQAAAGVAVESIRDDGGAHFDSSGKRYRFEVDDKPRTKLFTFAARVLSVIDGDTLWADIDCGFGISIEEKLRLRGIDTPERNTDEGVRAKLYVTEALRGVDAIAVSTSTTDLYDRYVADVFYLPGEADPRQIARRGRYLNRELLDSGLATVFEK